MTFPGLAETLWWLAAGAGLGAVYLYLIGRTVAAITRASAWTAAAGFLLLRLGLAGGTLALAAMQGASALILVLCGFLIVRTVAIHRARER